MQNISKFSLITVLVSSLAIWTSVAEGEAQNHNSPVVDTEESHGIVPSSPSRHGGSGAEPRNSTALHIESNDPDNPFLYNVSVAAQPKPPDVESFIAVPTWQLDITWHARDTYEDRDYSAGLEMTATARYILKRIKKYDHRATWGAKALQSWNMAYSGFAVFKGTHRRDDYSANSKLIGAETEFIVGMPLKTEYEFLAYLETHLKWTSTAGGTQDSAVILPTWDMSNSASRQSSGPLPATANTITGSLVIPACVPPFCNDPIPFTRLGIQYVLQPYKR